MKQTFSIPSSNNKNKLAIYVWRAKKQKLAIQLIHGMAEFAERYEPFIHYLNKHDITVIAHDHVGHGHSVDPNHPEYGFIAEQHPVEVILEDIHHVRNVIHTAFPELTIVGLGHSMGSFALRLACVKYPNDYAGVIFMGSGSAPTLLSFANLLANIANYFDPHTPNKLIHNATFAFYPLHYHEPYHPLNWISLSKANRRIYSHDPLLGFTFTGNGFYTLFHLVKWANHPLWFTHFPKELPTLFVSGADDPIGQYGKGVKKIARNLERHGVHNVRYYLFNQLRHEILNEDHPLQIMDTIYEWLQEEIMND